MATVDPSGAPPLVIRALAPPAPIKMTAEEFLALPDDGMDRDLICGKLREWGMTVGNRFHSCIESRIVHLLGHWWLGIMAGGGEVHSGEVGCRLNDGATLVGIDVAYFDQETIDRQSGETTTIDGAPVLAVEILSPNDTVQKVHDKSQTYLAAGVKQVWNVDPYSRIVVVLRPGQSPALYNDQQELAGDPELPGFKAPVRSFFE